MKSFRVKVKALLDWSEKYTKTDMTYLLKGGFWLTLGQVVLAIISLALSVALANLVSPDVLGQYKFVLAGAGIIGAFSLTGMSVAVIQTAARNFDGSLLKGTFDSLRWSLGTGLLALGLCLYYLLNNNTELSLSFLTVAICAPLIQCFSLYSPFLNGKKKFFLFTYLNVIRQGLLALAIVITAVLTGNAFIMILSYFVVEAITTSVYYFLVQKKHTSNNNYDPKNLPYSKHLSLMNFSKLIAPQIDKVMLFSSWGAAPLAVYTIALAPISQLQAIDQILANLAFPKFSQRSFEELQRTLIRKVFFLTCVMGVICVAYILSAPFIFKILFPQYIESVIYSQVFSLSLLLAPSVLFIKALTAHRKIRSLYIINTGMPLLRIACFIITIPFFGIWGAIFSYLAISCVSVFVTLYLFLKEGESNFEFPN